MKDLLNRAVFCMATALVTLGSADTALAQGNTLNINPSPLVFCAEPGQAISTTPIAISTTTGTQFFTVTVSSDGDWLYVNEPVGTATTDQLPLLLAGLKGSVVTRPIGIYNGQIVLSNNGAVVATIPAVLNVSATACTGGGAALVTATPGSMVFQLPQGVTTGAQQLLLTNTFPKQVIVALQANTTAATNWISVIDNFNLSLVPGTMTPMGVAVSSVGLDPGVYHGDVEFFISNTTYIDLPVTMIVGGSATSAAPQANPNPLAINLPFGAATTRQSIQLTNPNSSPINITTDLSFLTGRNWLTINPAAQLVPANSSATLTATINASGLTAGVNNAFVNVAVLSGGGAKIEIPVQVSYGTASGNSSMNVMPAQLSFAYQRGAAAPAAQTLNVSSSSAVNFTVQASGGAWLTSAQSTGTTTEGAAPSTIAVPVNPAGLLPGTYKGQIAVSNASTGEQQLIPVTLLVSDQPVLAAGNSTTTFTYQSGSATIPATQIVPLNSSGDQLAFVTSVNSISGGDFLLAALSSGNTPQNLTLNLDPTALPQLAPNSYSANVVVGSAGAGNTPVTYPVVLNVTSASLLSPSQSAVNFNYQIGQAAPAAQFINIGSSGGALDFAVATSSTNCSGFLAATSSGTKTPGVILVSVNPAGLKPGTCSGSVNLISTAAGNSPASIPVTLNVANTPSFNVSPGAINVTTQVGTNPPTQAVSVTSTDGTTPLNVTVSSAMDTSKGWLVPPAASLTTPGTINVAFKTTGMAAGTYTGRIDITPTGGAPVTVPVTLTITASHTASVAPPSLVFTEQYQGQPVAAQTLQLASTTPGILYTASAATFNGGNWLSVNAASQMTPVTLNVGVNTASLGQGSYSGIVTIVVPGMANTPLNVPVTLIVGPPPPIAASPSTLAFHDPGDGTAALSQTVQVTSPAGSVPFTVTTAVPNGAVNFLTANPASGVTPAAVTVGLSATTLATLAAGQYSGTVTLASTGASQTVNVALVVDRPAPSIASAVNSANFQAGAVSPGEMISIFGSALGPQAGVFFTLTPQGTVPLALANTTVTFDGHPAPLTFVRADQINAMVPYEVAGNATTSMVVSRNGVPSAAMPLAVVDTAPAIFSLGQGGNGLGAIRNADGSVNGPDNPAAKGSVIQIYATGEGICSGVATGSVTPSQPPFPVPAANVSLNIGGKPAQIQYAGEAPGAVSGLLQVNAIVPPNVDSGAQTVLLTIGNQSNSAQAIQVSVQ